MRGGRGEGRLAGSAPLKHALHNRHQPRVRLGRVRVGAAAQLHVQVDGLGWTGGDRSEGGQETAGQPPPRTQQRGHELGLLRHVEQRARAQRVGQRLAQPAQVEEHLTSSSQKQGAGAGVRAACAGAPSQPAPLSDAARRLQASAAGGEGAAERVRCDRRVQEKELHALRARKEARQCEAKLAKLRGEEAAPAEEEAGGESAELAEAREGKRKAEASARQSRAALLVARDELKILRERLKGGGGASAEEEAAPVTVGGSGETLRRRLV